MLKLVVSLAIVGCWLTFISCGVISATSHPSGSSAQSHYERPSTKRGPYQKRVIVFVHGIFGDADGTWRYSPSVYWPRLLLSDEAFRDSDIYVASYSSPYFGNNMNVDEVVTNLSNRLVSDEIFSKHREVVFVCHSLGGLIVQRLLLTFRDYAQQVPFIYFFSTPETGAQLANLASVFSSDPLLTALIPGDENVYLQNLENEWKAARFHIHRFCAYEKKKYKGVLVVDRLSGTRNCDDPPLAINEDHVSIVKPDGVNHDSYVALQNAFRQYPVAIGKSGAQATRSHVKPSHRADKTLPPPWTNQRKEKPCQLENGQLVDCTDAEILGWGKPVLQRLENALQADMKAVLDRHKQFPDQNDSMARGLKIVENATLNRYLERDCANFVIYRAAVIARLWGGDPDPHPALRYLCTNIAGGLSDQFSKFVEARSVWEDLRDISQRLSQQIPPTSQRNWLSDDQRFALKKELGALAGNSVRLLLIGNSSSGQLKYQGLLDVFEKWKIEPASVGSAPGANVPDMCYLTAQNASSPLVGNVYSMFQRAGVDLRFVPSAYMGPVGLGEPRGVVIVIQ
jgi:pimeloyl-ACP methyl ester carboxylesterase